MAPAAGRRGSARESPVSKMAAASPLAAIIGPTASGKSELAMAVAARLPVEILVADSRQVYRGDVDWHREAQPRRAARGPTPHARPGRARRARSRSPIGSHTPDRSWRRLQRAAASRCWSEAPACISPRWSMATTLRRSPGHRSFASAWRRSWRRRDWRPLPSASSGWIRAPRLEPTSATRAACSAPSSVARPGADRSTGRHAVRRQAGVDRYQPAARGAVPAHRCACRGPLSGRPR